MRNTTPTQSVEKLLRALFEGIASDGLWVEHNGCPLPIPAAHPGQRPGPCWDPPGGPGRTRCGACEEEVTLGNMGVACVIPTFVGIGVW
jgi:hypothetical protein